MRNVCKLPLVLGAALGVIALGRHRKIPRGRGAPSRTRRETRKLGRLGVAVGATYASTAGAQGVRLRRPTGRARPGPRAQDRRGRRRSARPDEGGDDEDRPDGLLPRRRVARAVAPGVGRAAVERSADVRRARRRGDPERARQVAGGVVPQLGSGADRGGVDRSGAPRLVRDRPPASNVPLRPRSSTPASTRRSQRPGQHRPLGLGAQSGLRWARPGGDDRGDQTAPGRRARLPARGAQPTGVRRSLPRPSVHPCPRGPAGVLDRSGCRPANSPSAPGSRRCSEWEPDGA